MRGERKKQIDLLEEEGEMAKNSSRGMTDVMSDDDGKKRKRRRPAWLGSSGDAGDLRPTNQKAIGNMTRRSVTGRNQKVFFPKTVFVSPKIK